MLAMTTDDSVQRRYLLTQAINIDPQSDMGQKAALST